MKPLFRYLCMAAVSATVGAIAPSAVAQAPAAPKPPSADAFGRQPAIDGVSLSPDGKHIAALVSADGVDAHIAVWSTAAMNKPPIRIGCGQRSDCVGVDFVKNDRIAVIVRQLITVGSVKSHSFRFFTTDLEGKVWRNADGELDQSAAASANVIDSLPKDPQNILVVIYERKSPNGSTIPDGGIYRLNIYTGTKSRIYQGSDKFFSSRMDYAKEVRARQSLEFENGAAYFVQWIKDSKGVWAEHFRWYPKEREESELIGFSKDPNIAYIRSNKGRDKYAIYEYDVDARKLGEVIFETKFFDARSALRSGSAVDEGELLGFSYAGETSKVYWTDPTLAAIAKGAREALGVKTVPVQWTDIASGEKGKFSTADGFDAYLSGWSDDRKYAIITKTGPRQPDEYYLLNEGKLTLLGKTRPWLDTTTLGDTRLVEYAARDGLMIPGFLTTPRKEIYGAGPYPTIILPHGGPWARDNMNWDFSGWTQYFASRGYAVLQPQYRGSRGWGQKLWRAGDAEWGLKMQDDKDDGAKWLIAQGVAAPDRIAMHGYSYGGYAAMMASIRPNGIYQCAVAGAGVASLEKFRTQALGNRIQREYQRPSLAGLSPVDLVKDVSIPIFLYHGDRDTNVDEGESTRFVSGLKSAGKPYKFLSIPDMGHEADKWEAGQVAQVLTAIESYLVNDCGPGGL